MDLLASTLLILKEGGSVMMLEIVGAIQKELNQKPSLKSLSHSSYGKEDAQITRIFCRSTFTQTWIQSQIAIPFAMGYPGAPISSMEIKEGNLMGFA